jgi:hypothetical protein
MSDRISPDDRDADKKIIRDNLMDELCKRQKNFEKTGDQRWRFTELWQSGFSVFTDKHFVNEIVEEYRKESGYFEIDTNDMISLTDR